MSREQLCTLLALPHDSGVHQIRSRAARLATGRGEFGSSPAKRKTIVEALRLAPGSSDLAIVRVVCSIIAPHPLSHRREVHVGTVDASDARTLRK